MRAVRVEIEFYLEEPREFIYRPTGSTAVGTYVRWESYMSPIHTYSGATLFAENNENMNLNVDRPEDKGLPGWVPLPPKGWDQIVLDEIAKKKEA